LALNAISDGILLEDLISDRASCVPELEPLMHCDTPNGSELESLMSDDTSNGTWNLLHSITHPMGLSMNFWAANDVFKGPMVELLDTA
jgi:hypothetical protein